jgi:ribosomal protein L29
MIAKLKNEIKALKEQLHRLRPSIAPGGLTNATTRGVTRRPTAKSTQSSKANVPRWL